MITPKYFPPLPVLVETRNPGTIAKQRHQLLEMNGKIILPKYNEVST
ncbi:unnamed protein product [Tenebrio molitor]|nr:unnamed protein product [Tenebrio molitor]